MLGHMLTPSRLVRDQKGLAIKRHAYMRVHVQVCGLALEVSSAPEPHLGIVSSRIDCPLDQPIYFIFVILI